MSLNYQQTIEYLFEKLPMFSHIGASAIKKDLTNTIALCEALGNPHHQFKSIHVAGTNGKGSTSHMLASLLQEAGYKTGLYTSPHLTDFRERIKVNGVMCSERFVMDFTERIRPLIESIEPSFFEITVAMAFAYFAEQQVDIAVIEVGLGGRLDSTNIIQPILSIITNIGWDHMSLLGNTLPAIASEKAGIIKPNTPVVIGEFLSETKPVFEAKATQENAPMFFAQQLHQVVDTQVTAHRLEVEVAHLIRNEHETYSLDLTGLYQTHNLLTVLEATHQLQTIGFPTEKHTLHTALQHVKKNTGLHGRWELLHEHPQIIADVGHNEDGMRQIVAQLEHSHFNHLHIVIGMAKDKAVDQVLALLPTYANYYFTKAQIPRALNEQSLQTQAAAFNLEGHAYENVQSALQSAVDKAQENDLILVCGSVFVVGEINLGLIRF